MPKIDAALYDKATTSASAGNGGGHNIDPGCYVCAIQKIELLSDSWLKEPSFDLVFDVVEGDKAGTFSDEWSAEHTFAHRVTVNYGVDPSNQYSSLRNLKSLATAVDQSNPGTDFLAAFEADRFMMLVGKKFGLLVNGEERTSDSGYTNVNISRFKFTIFPADMVRNGEVKMEPRVKLENRAWKDAVTWDEYQAMQGARNGAAQSASASYGSQAYNQYQDVVPF